MLVNTTDQRPITRRAVDTVLQARPTKQLEARDGYTVIPPASLKRVGRRPRSVVRYSLVRTLGGRARAQSRLLD